MTMRRIGDCLDSELIARIQEKMGGTSAGGLPSHRPSRNRREEENPSGNVIVMPMGRRMATASRRACPSAAVVIHLDMVREERHARSSIF